MSTELYRWSPDEWTSFLTGKNTAPDPPTDPGDFPDATNTGASGTLTPFSGDRTISSDNVTIENQDITGNLMVTGANFTLRNCILRYDSYWPFRYEGSGPALVEDCTFINGPGSQCSISGQNITVRRCNLSGAPDGIKLGANSLIVDTYIHDLGGIGSEFHHDGIDILGNNITIRHCTIKNQHGETSCVFMDGEFDPEDITVTQCLLAGAGYTIYGPDGFGGHGGRRIEVSNNKFSTQYWPTGGLYGPVAYWGDGAGTNTWVGNQWNDGPNAGNPVTP